MLLCKSNASNYLLQKVHRYLDNVGTLTHPRNRQRSPHRGNSQKRSDHPHGRNRIRKDNACVFLAVQMIFSHLKIHSEVPQYLLESGISGTGAIAVTQPRRVAATSLASRVALEQNGSSVGKLVGYSVRFDEKYSSETRIKYMTDGMIVQELLSDPLLSRYSVVIVDEAHERTLRTDLLLANLKTILQKRREGTQDRNKGKGKGKEESPGPLKIVVMSATLDAEKFSKFFHK